MANELFDSNSRPRHFPWYFFAASTLMFISFSMLANPWWMRIYFGVFAVGQAGVTVNMIWQNRVKFSLWQLLVAMFICALLAAMSRFFEKPLNIFWPLALGLSWSFIVGYSVYRLVLWGQKR